MRFRSQNGIMLVLALFLMGIFLIMGMGFLQQRVGQNRAAVAALNEVQARAAARAGIEDAMAKLTKDFRFPPKWDGTQKEYTYSELLKDVDGEVVGGYTLSIDSRYDAGQYWLYRITSQGIAGPPASPSARCTLHTELDVSTIERPLGGGWFPPQLPNPHFFELFFIRQGEPL